MSELSRPETDAPKIAGQVIDDFVHVLTISTPPSISGKGKCLKMPRKTTLIELVKRGDIHIVHSRLENSEDGSFPSEKDESGFTPMHYASAFGMSAMVRLLLIGKEDSSAVDHCYGLTPLHLAVIFERKDCFDELFKSGAKLLCCSLDGFSVLNLIELYHLQHWIRGFEIPSNENSQSPHYFPVWIGDLRDRFTESDAVTAKEKVCSNLQNIRKIPVSSENRSEHFERKKTGKKCRPKLVGYAPSFMQPPAKTQKKPSVSVSVLSEVKKVRIAEDERDKEKEKQKTADPAAAPTLQTSEQTLMEGTFDVSQLSEPAMFSPTKVKEEEEQTPMKEALIEKEEENEEGSDQSVILSPLSALDSPEGNAMLVDRDSMLWHSDNEIISPIRQVTGSRTDERMREPATASTLDPAAAKRMAVLHLMQWKNHMPLPSEYAPTTTHSHSGRATGRKTHKRPHTATPVRPFSFDTQVQEVVEKKRGELSHLSAASKSKTTPATTNVGTKGSSGTTGTGPKLRPVPTSLYNPATMTKVRERERGGEGGEGPTQLAASHRPFRPASASGKTFGPTIPPATPVTEFDVDYRLQVVKENDLKRVGSKPFRPASAQVVIMPRPESAPLSHHWPAPYEEGLSTADRLRMVQADRRKRVSSKPFKA